MGRTERPGPAPARRARALPGAPGEVRIIGGRWRRSRLRVPAHADIDGLRPTPDRVRETLFNWLGQDLSGWRVLDAFAGTGALGLEAASRGAAEVLLVERDPRLVRELADAVQRLEGAAAVVRVQRGDGIGALQACASASLDLVLLDPPFDAGLFDDALRAAARAVAPGGWVYLEAPEAWDDARLQALAVAASGAAQPGLQVQRHLRAGMVHAHLLCGAPSRA